MKKNPRYLRHDCESQIEPSNGKWWPWIAD